MPYLRRTVDDELDDLLPGLAAIALDGAKGAGKTETAERRAASQFRLDSLARRRILEADPAAVLRAEPPVLIDEWQLVPEVWDVVRRQVDRDPTPGQFLLTGSASPRPGATAHSGAGRIVRLRIRPMTLTERLVETPSVSLRRLLAGGQPALEGETGVALPTYVDEILRSGFPGIRDLPPRARRAQLDGYVRGVVDRDVPENGLLVRKPDVLLGWLRAYAAATSTTSSYNRILDAATPGESDKPAKTTGMSYRDALTTLWLLDPVPGWSPTRSPPARLQQAPKHHLADPALAARLLGATTDTLLAGEGDVLSPRDGTLLGHLFESLATLCVRVAAQAAEATVGHLRTRDGDHEVDLVVVRDDGKVVACEVKLAAALSDRDVRHLTWLRNRLGEDLLDAVVLTTGPAAYRRADGIGVVPLALVGP
ncbi:ATP-binding protein [Aquipuribacter nitratireducens]|uniref:ATP-binding protein n=1 Tax=Aquipuribacter nitratireducens TaxID=650104 RepID=A0ABW0GJS7_9MICO